MTALMETTPVLHLEKEVRELGLDYRSHAKGPHSLVPSPGDNALVWSHDSRQSPAWIHLQCLNGFSVVICIHPRTLHQSG
jgi:hypothetical protein